MENIYHKYGYKNRMDYLESVADEYVADIMIVSNMAEVLGESEDFDALISQLEDLPVL